VKTVVFSVLLKKFHKSSLFFSYACLLQVENEVQLLNPKEHLDHKKYARQGMIKRVLTERRQKADKAEYRIKWAGNIYGDHILTNESDGKYKVFLRDFENETGYSDSMDAKLNKPGTTKHIMFAFRQLKENKALYKRLSNGKEMGLEGQKIEVNKETGEVTMKFKLPV
jgi:hypothetical protein